MPPSESIFSQAIAHKFRILRLTTTSEPAIHRKRSRSTAGGYFHYYNLVTKQVHQRFTIDRDRCVKWISNSNLASITLRPLNSFRISRKKKKIKKYTIEIPTNSVEFRARLRTSHPLTADWTSTADCSRLRSFALSIRAALVCSMNCVFDCSPPNNILAARGNANRFDRRRRRRDELRWRFIARPRPTEKYPKFSSAHDRGPKRTRPPRSARVIGFCRTENSVTDGRATPYAFEEWFNISRRRNAYAHHDNFSNKNKNTNIFIANDIT